MEDYYKILQVNRDASFEEIKKSFRRLAKEYHPDKNPNNPKVEDIFKKLNDAYMILGDSDKRSSYNRKLVKYEQENSSDVFQTNQNQTQKSKASNFDFFQTNDVFTSFFGFDTDGKRQKKVYDDLVQPVKNKDLFDKFFGKGHF